MLGALGMVVAETFHPLFGGSIEGTCLLVLPWIPHMGNSLSASPNAGPAIFHFQQIPAPFWQLITVRVRRVQGSKDAFAGRMFSLARLSRYDSAGHCRAGDAPCAHRLAGAHVRFVTSQLLGLLTRDAFASLFAAHPAPPSSSAPTTRRVTMVGTLWVRENS